MQRTCADIQHQVDQLKEAVRRKIFTTIASDFSHQLKLIDTIQRLGVVYHFEREIEESLDNLHATIFDYHGDNYGDLYNVALGFRILRQHGYNAPCGRLPKSNMYAREEKLQ